FKLTFRELVHPEDQPLYGTLVGELSEDAPVFEIIHSLVCGDGRIIRVRNALALIQEGEACTILSTIEEITGRQAGREDEQRMRFLADNSPDFISLSEPEGTIFYLNKAGRDMLGIAPGAAGPHSNNEHLPPAELTRM